MRVLDVLRDEGKHTMIVVPNRATYPRYQVQVTPETVEVYRQLEPGGNVIGPCGIPHRLMPFVLEALSLGTSEPEGAFGPAEVTEVTEYQLGVERRIGRSALEGRLVNLRPSPEDQAEAEDTRQDD